MKLLPKILPSDPQQRRARLYREQLRREAKMGGELFGPVPKGHRREFFCLDKHTWVWHEEWTDADGKLRAMTTRYDIRPQGILKSQGSHSYQLVRGAELRNFYQAARMYGNKLNRQLAELQQTQA